MSGSYADLSLSELSLNDRPIPGSSKQPFSLLARPSTSTSPREIDDDDNLHEESIFDQDQADEHADDVQERVGDDEVVEAAAAHAEEEEATQRAESKRSVAYNREERLRQDLFVLRKLNTAFSGYNEALGDVHSGTERVSEQLAQTNALLDKYVSLLVRSEQTTKLIFDERWWGAEDDESTLAEERRHAEEKARKEAEERARAEQAERERLAKEEAARLEREERERVEAARREKLAARAGYGGGVRGVRGTRASMRGARGATTGTRVSPGSTSLTRGTSASAVRGSRPGSSASSRSARPPAR